MSELIMSIIAIIALYGVFSIVGIGCPIKFLTGISCAGCGMTRAWKCLLTGKIEEAFDYHPLVLLPLLFVIFYTQKKKIPQKLYDRIVIVMAILFLIVYVARMLNQNDLIVEFDIKNGFLFLIFNFLGEVCNNFF